SRSSQPPRHFDARTLQRHPYRVLAQPPDHRHLLGEVACALAEAIDVGADVPDPGEALRSAGGGEREVVRALRLQLRVNPRGGVDAGDGVRRVGLRGDVALLIDAEERAGEEE